MLKIYQDDITPQLPIELEATLVICSENAQDIANRISKLTFVSDYQLIPQKSKDINDLYWDTSKEILRENKTSLRLRKIDEDLLITIKGGASLTEWGGVERLEIEVPWSKNGFFRIIRELKNYSIDLPQNDKNFNMKRPQESFVNLGLELIQDRKTDRKIRNIILNDEQEILSELAIDSVYYKVKDQIVRHFEIEIESKHKNGPEVVKTTLKCLSDMFGSLLRNWPHSKLTTGMALAQLLRKEQREKYINSQNCILPGTYDTIFARLGSDVM